MNKDNVKNKIQEFLLPDNLSEGYILTTSRRHVGLYGERFIDTLVQATVQELKVAEGRGFFSSGILNIEKKEDGSRYITFSIGRVMANAVDHNYDDAEEALRKLESLFFEYRDEKVWKSRALITDPEIDKVEHVARFRIPLEIWEAVQNKTEGYRVFCPSVAYKVKSPYSYRLYKLISGQKQPISYKLEEIKKMLGVGDKYSRVVDFCKRVLDTSVNELKETSDWYFDYELKSSVEAKAAVKRGRPALDLIVFYPRQNLDKRSVQKEAQLHTGGNAAVLLPSNLLRHLKTKIGFSDAEINNSRVIVPAYEIMKDKLLALLLDNTVIIDTANEKKSFTIGIIKNHVHNNYGVSLGKKKSDIDKEDSDKLF